MAALHADLAAAREAGDAEAVALFQALEHCGGKLVLYRPERAHYGVALGDVRDAPHVAVMVPGVGNARTLRDDWLPSARNLFEAAKSAAVVLWKGYDNPGDILAAAVGAIECDADLMAAGDELARFVESLGLRDGQKLTVVAHSFGSMVTGASLADSDLHPTDVVVAGSPGMTVDDLRALHLAESHFFSEQAPGDLVAELGVFGASPTSPTFGGTRMRTNAPDHEPVRAHSDYFLPGSEALENIVDVVTGRYTSIEAHRSSLPEIAGGLVSWAIRLPTVPLRIAGRNYRGQGFRVLINAMRAVDLTASQAGNLVTEVLDEGMEALEWVAAHVGSHEGTGPL
jgi:hypothetical protein